MEKIYLLFLLFLISSCTDSVTCTYELEDNLKLKVVATIEDINRNTYVVTKRITIEYNKKSLEVEMGRSERTGFYVRQRSMLIGEKAVNSLWLYNYESRGATAINLDEMKLLDGTSLSKGMSEWCLCYGFNVFGEPCAADDCLYLESCNLDT